MVTLAIKFTESESDGKRVVKMSIDSDSRDNATLNEELAAFAVGEATNRLFQTLSMENERAKMLRRIDDVRAASQAVERFAAMFAAERKKPGC